jgi:hypothetical protein
VKWLAVAELLLPRRLDLLANKRQASLEIEGTLLRVFHEVYERVDWDQWNVECPSRPIRSDVAGCRRDVGTAAVGRGVPRVGVRQ